MFKTRPISARCVKHIFIVIVGFFLLGYFLLSFILSSEKVLLYFRRHFDDKGIRNTKGPLMPLPHQIHEFTVDCSVFLYNNKTAEENGKRQENENNDNDDSDDHYEKALATAFVNQRTMQFLHPQDVLDIAVSRGCPSLIRRLGFDIGGKKQQQRRRRRRPLAFAILTQSGEFEQMLRLLRSLYNGGGRDVGLGGGGDDDDDIGDSGGSFGAGERPTGVHDATEDVICIHVDAAGKDGTWEALKTVAQCLREEEEEEEAKETEEENVGEAGMRSESSLRRGRVVVTSRRQEVTWGDIGTVDALLACADELLTYAPPTIAGNGSGNKTVTMETHGDRMFRRFTSNIDHRSNVIFGGEN